MDELEIKQVAASVRSTVAHQFQLCTGAEARPGRSCLLKALFKKQLFMVLLTRPCGAAAAAAEVEALKSADFRHSVLDVPVSDKQDYVRQFVEQHSSPKVKDKSYRNVTITNRRFRILR